MFFSVWSAPSPAAAAAAAAAAWLWAPPVSFGDEVDLGEEEDACFQRQQHSSAQREERFVDMDRYGTNGTRTRMTDGFKKLGISPRS